MGEATYPPALPKWEGGLMREDFGISPTGETGEGLDDKTVSGCTVHETVLFYVGVKSFQVSLSPLL